MDATVTRAVSWATPKPWPSTSQHDAFDLYARAALPPTALPKGLVRLSVRAGRPDDLLADVGEALDWPMPDLGAGITLLSAPWRAWQQHFSVL